MTCAVGACLLGVCDSTEPALSRPDSPLPERAQKKAPPAPAATRTATKIHRSRDHADRCIVFALGTPAGCALAGSMIDDSTIVLKLLAFEENAVGSLVRGHLATLCGPGQIASKRNATRYDNHAGGKPSIAANCFAFQ